MLGGHSRILLPLLVAMVPVGACRGATSISVEVTTDIPCSDLKGTQITVGRLSELESRPPSAVNPTCDASGRIGMLVVVPSGERGDEVAIRVVSGFGRAVEDCVPPYPKGCIVARRALHFVPHDELSLPIVMRASCNGIPCGATETCYRGTCVPATISDSTRCNGGGCAEELLYKGATPTSVEVCGAGSGAQKGSPWPMEHLCPDHRRQSAFDGPATTPRALWTFATDGEVAQPGLGKEQLPVAPVIASDGTIFVASAEGRLYALDPATGKPKWTFVGAGPFAAPAIGRDSTVFVTSAVAKLYAVNPATGTAVWPSPATLESSSYVGATIGGDGTVYVSTTSQVQAVRPTDGSILWSYPTGSTIAASPPAIGLDGTVWVTSADGFLHGISALDGRAIVSKRVSNGGNDVVSIAPDGTLRAFSTSEPLLYAVDPKSLVANWTGNTVGLVYDVAINSAGTTFTASHNGGGIYAFDLKGSGTKLGDGPGRCVTPTLDRAGALYVPCADKLVSLTADGKLRWELTTPGPSQGSTPIAKDGTLYHTALFAGKLTAYGL